MINLKLITLQAIPNQAVIVTPDNIRYKIAIKSASGFMTYGIEKAGETILENGTRLVNGSPLFPYKYLEDGNFILDMPEDEEPDYEKFGVTQFLRFFTQEELESVR